MQPLPVTDLRTNTGTWAVLSRHLPALARQMTNALPTEDFDPEFLGQVLDTTYFDTRAFTLRKSRVKKDKYLTLRIRCYGPADTYALSAKTENQKHRQEIDGDLAELLLAGGIAPAFWPDLLPADLLARLMDLVGSEPLVPVVTVRFRRYAVEDESDRLTLDTDIRTDTGKCHPAHVLEHKSINSDRQSLVSLPLRPIKLSKFLWATS